MADISDDFLMERLNVWFNKHNLNLIAFEKHFRVVKYKTSLRKPRVYFLSHSLDSLLFGSFYNHSVFNSLYKFSIWKDAIQPFVGVTSREEIVLKLDLMGV